MVGIIYFVVHANDLISSLRNSKTCDWFNSITRHILCMSSGIPNTLIPMFDVPRSHSQHSLSIKQNRISIDCQNNIRSLPKPYIIIAPSESAILPPSGARGGSSHSWPATSFVSDIGPSGQTSTSKVNKEILLLSFAESTPCHSAPGSSIWILMFLFLLLLIIQRWRILFSNGRCLILIWW